MELCSWHCCQNNRSEKSKFCGSKCKNKYYVDRKRRNLKLKSIEYKGGSCQMCGYDKCPDALDFHHRDEKTKAFSISHEGYTYAWSRLQKELDKCDIICANCHREIHAQMNHTKRLRRDSNSLPVS